jgi:hypothetical protein
MRQIAGRCKTTTVATLDAEQEQPLADIWLEYIP